MQEILHFKVSSGLKNIIGRELINDKYIAIFELVKNSYDAGAHDISIRFENLGTPRASITVEDDGCGMSKEDIINKWLFVAYSEKRNPSYRDKIKRAVAGAKGVGRFSCDRLGERVVLQSKVQSEEIRHEIDISWNDFEQNSLDNFSDINVNYRNYIETSQESGTKITILNLREMWSRSDLLLLKKALTQLVNPASTNEYDRFQIMLHSESDLERDLKEPEERNKVNGVVKNNIFEILDQKTVKMTVTISPDGKFITTEIRDRDINKLGSVEKNEFSLSDISCTLYFLNKAAKDNFKRRVGVEVVNYGSIFIYKHGFRVYPYGEPGQDFFDIDQRKGQGYKRYLGTRDVIGRLEINGTHNNLIETSSRNNGFINTPHMQELQAFFMEYVLKPFEKYIVNVTKWASEPVYFNLSAMDSESQIFELLKKIKPRSKKEAYISTSFSCYKAMPVVPERENGTAAKIQELRELALETENDDIVKKTEELERHTRTLEKRFAEASHEAQETRTKYEKAEAALNVVKKQVGVLEARADLTAADAIDAMHVIKGYADAIDSVIAEIFEISEAGEAELLEIKPYLHSISQMCEKIKNSYNIVIRTSYSAGTDDSRENVIAFMEEYFQKLIQPIYVQIDNPKNIKGYAKFNPLEFSVILDNIISNSHKANAQMITFLFDIEQDSLRIVCRDDGYGLRTDTDSNRLFEAGYSTTSGSGIGLHTIKKYIEKRGGRVEFNPDYKNGFELTLYLKLWT